MPVRRLLVGWTLFALTNACGTLPAVHSLPGATAAVQNRTARPTGWAIAAVTSAPQAVLTTLEQEKATVLHEIQQAEHLKSVAMSPDVAIREWRIGGTVAGYVLTMHGNVVFDVPNMHKAGAFIVDFCIDPSGTDFGGVYAFTVNSEHPAATLRQARKTRNRTSNLSLERVAQKPEAIRAASEALKGSQQQALAAQYPGVTIAPIKSFNTAIAVRQGGEVIGYIDSQTTSALPHGDVIGFQVLNHYTPDGQRLFGEARAASANDPNGYRTIRL
jgi:hypothetical protein